VKEQQKTVQQKKADLLAAKGEKSSLLRQSEQERKKLEVKKDEQKQLLFSLQKKQKDVQKEISQKQKQSQRLNEQIDRLVEQEIAAAKKREEERRKKEMARLEAERRKKAELAKNSEKEVANGKESENIGKSSKSVASGNNSNTSKAKAERMGAYKVDDEDRLVSGGFERNKGLMPVPITGPYMIVGHYGVYTVAGLKGVKLDNKGIDIKGQSGASARSIFQGEVSSVFSYGGMRGVLIRHGSYISVYCNLSSVNVRAGQKVKARDTIGKVARNEDGDYVLQFQLRRETRKLNPEQWLSRR
jgi:septal ring factor EnvC (AmiA/AmiB activator)